MGLCAYIMAHTILPPSPVILWVELGGKPKWLPLNSGYHDVMHMSPIGRFLLFFLSMFLRPAGSDPEVVCQKNSFLKVSVSLGGFGPSVAMENIL